jgi:hypothetical protein
MAVNHRAQIDKTDVGGRCQTMGGGAESAQE